MDHLLEYVPCSTCGSPFARSQTDVAADGNGFRCAPCVVKVAITLHKEASALALREAGWALLAVFVLSFFVLAVVTLVG